MVALLALERTLALHIPCKTHDAMFIKDSSMNIESPCNSTSSQSSKLGARHAGAVEHALAKVLGDDGKPIVARPELFVKGVLRRA